MRAKLVITQGNIWYMPNIKFIYIPVATKIMKMRVTPKKMQVFILRAESGWIMKLADVNLFPVCLRELCLKTRGFLF